MSASPGKVVIDGVASVNGEDVFVCRFLQCRDSEYVNRPFFAAHSAEAEWLDDLRPAVGEDGFPFEQRRERISISLRPAAGASFAPVLAPMLGRAPMHSPTSIDCGC
jgi:hypothetical protein